MTKSRVYAPGEIAELQTKLKEQGFDLEVDDIYGQKTRDAYAAYLDRDSRVPTIVPPANKPWWTSKTAIFALTTVLISLSALFGITLDAQTLTETLTALATLVSGLLTLWANARRSGSIDSSLVAPGLRLETSGGVPAQGKSDSGSPPGPFGY